MADRQIPRKEWKSFFDQVSTWLSDEKAELEVAGLDIGVQLQEEWTPLEGLSFDKKGDAIFVHTLGLDHQIVRPEAVLVTETDAGALTSVTIKDQDGQLHLVRLRQPLMRREAPRKQDETTGASAP